MKFMKFNYVGEVEEYYIFTYMDIDKKMQTTRIKPIDDKYEMSVGFGEFRTKLIIEQQSKMGKDITNQIKK